MYILLWSDKKTWKKKEEKEMGDTILPLSVLNNLKKEVGRLLEKLDPLSDL